MPTFANPNQQFGQNTDPGSAVNSIPAGQVTDFQSFLGAQADPLGLFSQSSSQQNPNFVDPLQQQFLAGLFGSGQGLQQGLQPGLNQFSQQQIPGLFNQGVNQNQFQSNLAQGVGNDPGINQGLNTLQNFSNGSALQGQISNLGDSLGTFFNEQLLPGLDTQSQLGGQQVGSARNSVARGQATRDVANAFSRGSADLTAQFGQQQINAAQAGVQGGINQFAQQGMLNNQSIQNLPGLAGLGLSQFTAPFAGLNQQANLLGTPATVVGGGGTQQGGGMFGSGGGGGLLGALF